MIKTTKLPQKKVQTLNHYDNVKIGKNETDTTSITMSTITSTHIFNK